MTMLDDRFLRFLLVGLINTGIGYACIVALEVFAGFSAIAANAGGYATGFLISYLLNRRYTFRSSAAHVTTMSAFALSAGASYLLNVGVLLVALDLGIASAAAQAIAMVSYTLSFYALSRYFVFRSASERPEQ